MNCLGTDLLLRGGHTGCQEYSGHHCARGQQGCLRKSVRNCGFLWLWGRSRLLVWPLLPLAPPTLCAIPGLTKGSLRQLCVCVRRMDSVLIPPSAHRNIWFTFAQTWKNQTSIIWLDREINFSILNLKFKFWIYMHFKNKCDHSQPLSGIK